MKKTRTVTKGRSGRARAAGKASGPGPGQGEGPGPGKGTGPGVGAKRTAQVSELKAGLSAYLAWVKSGEEVIVTDRGTPVAKLVPIPRTADHEMERLRDMERRGLIKLGTGTIPPGFWDMPMPDDPGDGVLKALLEEREEEW